MFAVIDLALQKTERLQHFSLSPQLWFVQTFLPLSFAGGSLSPCRVISAPTTGLNSATDTERRLRWDPCCTLSCLQIKGCLTTPAKQDGPLVLYKQAPVSFAQISFLPFPSLFICTNSTSLQRQQKSAGQFPMPGYQVRKKTLTTFCCPFPHAQDSWFHGLIHYFKHT